MDKDNTFKDSQIEKSPTEDSCDCGRDCGCDHSHGEDKSQFDMFMKMFEHFQNQNAYNDLKIMSIAHALTEKGVLTTEELEKSTEEVINKIRESSESNSQKKEQEDEASQAER